MKMFSDCSGPCFTCAAFRHGCLAGHGDDDWSRASDQELRERLSEAEKMLLQSVDWYNTSRFKEEIKILKSELGWQTDHS